MLFDIRTPDSAFEFILEFFEITGKEFINQYIIECNSSIDEFIYKHLDYIDSKDINSLKYTAFHVTSNWNECSEIKTDGIKNLQKVLSEQSQLRALLLSYGVEFDITKKNLIATKKIIDIDYDKYCGQYGLSSYEKKIERVAHKIYYDYQVNGFFSNNNILNYATEIHTRPEFISNLTELLPYLKNAENYWRERSKGYIITFIADFQQFAWYTFYDHEYQYWSDEENKQQLKKWIISMAVNRSFDGINSHSEIFAYMNPTTIIKPEQIIDYKQISFNVK